MAAIKQGLEQKLQQKLSPLQIQTIKLIEMPVQALEQHVREVLNDNPVVDDTPQGGSDDEPRDVSISQVEAQEQSGGSLEENYGPQDDDIPSYNLHVNNWGKDERPEYNTFSVKQSFTQSLQEQLDTATSRSTSAPWPASSSAPWTRTAICEGTSSPWWTTLPSAPA